MNYFSMFSGVGGFELGIQRASDRAIEETPNSVLLGDSSNSTVGLGNGGRSRPVCIGYSEIDKYAIQTYEKNWKGHTNYGDATNINETELPDFDLLVGGFPCQAFSVAGKRLGFNETRGTLFFDIARILDYKRPGHLVLENVKGLLSHDGGKTFTTILGVLTDLGYHVEWQVLNAKDFGVPQNRERIFIVGHLGNGCGRKIFPLGGNNRTHTGAEPPQTANRPIVRENSNQHHVDQQFRGTKTATRQPLRFLDRNQRNIEGDYAFTVDASQTSGIRLDARIRKLTPTECERLMSWPDGWTEGVSDTQRYKQCGNGVVSNVVQAVITELKECLK